MNVLRVFVDFAVSPDVLRQLQDGTNGHQLVFAETPAASVLVQAKRDPQLATVDVAFGQPDPAAIAEAGRLRWVHVSTSSIARYDNPAFRALVTERRIAVSNSASVYSESCAVHAMAFLLAQARHLPQALQTRAASGTDAWLALRGSSVSLQGKTVLILGYGAIGRRLAELLLPFGAKTMAYRRQSRGDEGVPVITPDQLAAVLAREADHIVNVLPDSAETRGFFNHARFAAIKPGAVFYNLGRGTTVDQEALLAALRSRRIAAAWLDVTDPEPLPDDHPLRTEPNCFITPHVAGGHADETGTLVRHFLRNFERFVRGAPLQDRVM